MEKINPINRNERIEFLSKKLGMSELQLIHELGYEFNFTHARHFEIKDIANKARDLYNNELAKTNSKFIGTYFSLWFVFSAYYHMYDFRGTMIYSGVSDLTDGYIDAFSTGHIAEELQHLAYHGMIKLSDTFEYALQVQNIIFYRRNGGPNVQRSIDQLLKQIKTFDQAITAYKQISEQGDKTNEKLFHKVVKERMIEELKQSTELIQFANIYHKKKTLGISETIDDNIVKMWNTTALDKFNKANTLDQLKDVYENSYFECKVKYLALKKIVEILESGK
ncbi:MAG: hypothetical protein WA101_00650 [Minisyncoccia bacterium]